MTKPPHLVLYIYIYIATVRKQQQQESPIKSIKIATSSEYIRMSTLGDNSEKCTSIVLSARGRRTLKPHGDAVQDTIDEFGSVFAAAKRDMYDPETNPDGFIFANTAENKLSYVPLLDGMIKRACQWVPQHAAGYGDNIRFRSALASFFMKNIFTDKARVMPENIVVAAGVASVIDSVFWCVIDDGDGVLVPTPCYSSHHRNMSCRSGAHFIPVPCSPKDNFKLTPTMLATAADEAVRADGDAGVSGGCRKVKALLLTNPHNPCGSILDTKQLEAIIEWCTARGIHVVSDEVYSTSIFDREAEFTSVAQVARAMTARGHSRSIEQLVHVVYGLSKDWAMSGNRVGILYTTNSSLVHSMNELSIFNGVPGFFQHALSAVFEDEAFSEAYIVENKKLLEKSYMIISACLTKLGIEYVHASAGLFVWVCLEPLITSPSARFTSDYELYRTMMNDPRYRLLFTPGKICRAASPGWYRICWASLSVAALHECCRRIALLWTGEST